MIKKYGKVLIFSVLLTFVRGDVKKCRYMNPEMIHVEERSLWNPLTGFFCYYYTNDRSLNFRYNISLININGSQTFGTWINNTYFLYDYKDKIALSYIKLSFLEEHLFEKWKTCAREAADCCDNVMTAENIIPNEEYCPAVWDSWSCFPPAKANSISRVLCPEITFSSETRACELTSERHCLINGVWANSTNYATCALAPVLLNRLNFHVIFLSVTAALAFPSVVIFLSFRKFRQKLTFVLHRNLIVVLIIRSIFTIITKELILKENMIVEDVDSTVMAGNGVACRVLAFFENVSKNGIFACMLVDGFYLHQTIVRPFATTPSVIVFYITVFVISFVPSLIWALLRGLHGGTNCWMVDSSGDQWVSDGLRFAILAVNTLLLLDIIRVMILKLKTNGISEQAKTTLRVTLFLIPLFGLQIIVISNRNMVPDNTCRSYDIYYYFSYSLEGLQATAVAFLFCYMNTEVHRELKNLVRKVVIYLQQSCDSKSKYIQRRPTTATIVESFSEANC